MQFPQCQKSSLGLGFDLDYQACAGLGFMVCQPAIRDQGFAGIKSDKAFFNAEEEESYYKVRVCGCMGVCGGAGIVCARWRQKWPMGGCSLAVLTCFL